MACRGGSAFAGTTAALRPLPWHAQRFLLGVSEPDLNSMFDHDVDRASLEFFAAREFECAPVLFRCQLQRSRD